MSPAATATAMTDDEEILAGGNMTAVVRIGDTVRRAAGPWTPTIHAFLRHLRANGFDLVPEPLGMDERGREIISLLPGAPATYPLPAFAWADDTLAAVAQTLRAYHDASAGFEGTRWQWPSHEPQEVICHNDFAPYNLMFEDGRVTGVIDLDLASPGPRVLDLAYTAYRFVPLTDPANPDAPFPGEREQHRRLEASATPTEIRTRARSRAPPPPSCVRWSRSSNARRRPEIRPSRRSWPVATSRSMSATSGTSMSFRAASGLQAKPQAQEASHEHDPHPRRQGQHGDRPSRRRGQVDRVLRRHARAREARRRAVRRRVPLGRGGAGRCRHDDRDLPARAEQPVRQQGHGHQPAGRRHRRLLRGAQGGRRGRGRRGEPEGRPDPADVLVPRSRGKLADGRRGRLTTHSSRASRG